MIMKTEKPWYQRALRWAQTNITEKDPIRYDIDWGDGEWMRDWEERCSQDGASLASDSVICNEAPDDEALSACRALGAALAEK